MFYAITTLSNIPSYSIAMTATEQKSDFELTTDNPYLTTTDELWSVFCEYYDEHWPHYNDTTVNVAT